MSFQKLVFVLSFFTLIFVLADEKINFSQTPMAAGKAALTENGFYWNQIPAVANFSPDLKMPIQFFYNSASTKSGIIGYAWKIPQLESSAIPEKDGVIWTTPWGEKIRFFEKQKDLKGVLPVFKNAMKGKGFFSPFSDWNADGKNGSWTFSGKNKLEGWKFIYRDAKLRSISAPSGRTIEFIYSAGKLTSVRQSGIDFITIAYQGKFAASITVNGVLFQLKYSAMKVTVLPDSAGAQTREINRSALVSYAPAGLAPMEFAYDSFGYLNSIRQDRFSETIKVQHETLEQRLTFFKNMEQALKNKKSANSVARPCVAGRILEDLDFTYSYSSKEPGTVSLKNRAGQTASYDFNSKVGIFKTKDFSGKEKTVYYFMRYDVAYNGKIRQIVDGRGRVVVNYRYDKESGLVTRIRDMAKNDIFFQYDAKGNLLRILKRAADERESSPVLGFTYASRNNPSRILLLNESGEAVRTTSIVYDRNHQPDKISTGQQETVIRYNRLGYPVLVTNAFQQSVRVEYDKYNRILSNENFFGVKTVLTYTPAGLVSRVERRDGNDVLSFLEIAYNSAGQPVSYTDQAGRTKKFDRDAFGRVVKEYFPDDTSVDYSYTNLGQLSQVLDQNKHKIQFDWNKFGLDSRITAANQVMDYVYDKFGMLNSVVSKFKNEKKIDRKLQYEYDNLDRLVKITYGPNEVETFRYDTWGKVISSTKNGKSATFEYDYFGRMIQKTEGALVNKYAYNVYGQRTARLTVNGTFRQEERKSYDQYGRLVKIESGTSLVAYQYNEQNQLVSQTVNNMPIYFEYTKYGQLKKKILASK